MALRSVFGFFKANPAKVDVLKLANEIKEKAHHFGVIEEEPVKTAEEAILLIAKIDSNPRYCNAREKRNLSYLSYEWLAQFAMHVQEDITNGCILGGLFGAYMASSEMSAVTFSDMYRALNIVLGASFVAAWTLALVVGPSVRINLDHGKANRLEQDMKLLQQAVLLDDIERRSDAVATGLSGMKKVN